MSAVRSSQTHLRAFHGYCRTVKSTMQIAHHRIHHLQHVEYTPCTKRILQLRRWLFMHIPNDMLFSMISNRITTQPALGSAQQRLHHGRQPEANFTAVTNPVGATTKTSGRRPFPRDEFTRFIIGVCHVWRLACVRAPLGAIDSSLFDPKL